MPSRPGLFLPSAADAHGADEVGVVAAFDRRCGFSRLRADGLVRPAIPPSPLQPCRIGEPNGHGTGSSPAVARPRRNEHQWVQPGVIERLGFDIRGSSQDCCESSQLPPVYARLEPQRRKSKHAWSGPWPPAEEHRMGATRSAPPAGPHDPGTRQPLDRRRRSGAHRCVPHGKNLFIGTCRHRRAPFREYDPRLQPVARLGCILRHSPGGAAQLVSEPCAQRRSGGGSRPCIRTESGQRHHHREAQGHCEASTSVHAAGSPPTRTLGPPRGYDRASQF